MGQVVSPMIVPSLKSNATNSELQCGTAEEASKQLWAQMGHW